MTCPVLDPRSAARLVKLCGMLGSQHDGERAAAGLKADQLVRGLGSLGATSLCRPIPSRSAMIGGAWRNTAIAVAVNSTRVIGRRVAIGLS